MGEGRWVGGGREGRRGVHLKTLRVLSIDFYLSSLLPNENDRGYLNGARMGNTRKLSKQNRSVLKLSHL